MTSGNAAPDKCPVCPQTHLWDPETHLCPTDTLHSTDTQYPADTPMHPQTHVPPQKHLCAHGYLYSHSRSYSPTDTVPCRHTYAPKDTVCRDTQTCVPTDTGPPHRHTYVPRTHSRALANRCVCVPPLDTLKPSIQTLLAPHTWHPPPRR